MTAPVRWRLVARDGAAIIVVSLTADLVETERIRCTGREWFALARTGEPGVRWVWNDTTRWYPALLDAGVVIARCHDLRLCHAIVAASASVDAAAVHHAVEWEAHPEAETAAQAPTLFDLADASGAAVGLPTGVDAALDEFKRQRVALLTASDPARLQLLLAAESAGALLAVELRAAGVPWSREVHEGILEQLLGPRPARGEDSARVRELAGEVRAALGDPAASLDSQPKLLRSLHRVGVLATSTNRWELAEYDHPAISPLLAYKKLTRLASANGWAWLDEWAADGRFRPVYVPGGVVTGRWASSGGGALQLPRQLRPAVHADPGWTLVVADVAQLEPRMLAAISGDRALADAARGQDLYDGLVARGIMATRQDAKIAMLGAMYGATTGDSGRLVPALRRAYPRAMAFVDDAARTGEAGGVVSTWLGRSSPAPSPGWHGVQARAGAVDATEEDRARARRAARDRGRFTRNFVVQGTAAEWALAWLADLRGRLADLPEVTPDESAVGSGPVFSLRPHLCFFLHDEIIVHTPTRHADRVAELVRQAAERAARLLFDAFPIDIPLDLRICADAGKA